MVTLPIFKTGFQPRKKFRSLEWRICAIVQGFAGAGPLCLEYIHKFTSSCLDPVTAIRLLVTSMAVIQMARALWFLPVLLSCRTAEMLLQIRVSFLNRSDGSPTFFLLLSFIFSSNAHTYQNHSEFRITGLNDL